MFKVPPMPRFPRLSFFVYEAQDLVNDTVDRARTERERSRGVKFSVTR